LVVLIGLGLLAGPPWIGFLAARAGLAMVRPRGPVGRRILGLGVAAALTAAAFLLPWGAWDASLSAVLGGLGVLRGLRKPVAGAWRTDAGVLAAVLCVLGLLELTERVLGHRAQGVLPPGEALLFLDPREQSAFEAEACRVLYPAADSAVVRTRLALSSEGRPRVVLHLGDSMVYWFQVTPSESAIPKLDELDRAVRHVSAAVPPTDQAFQWLALRRWWPLVHPDVVVVHVCQQNDGAVDTYHYPCCRPDTLLDLSTDPPRERCPEPRTVEGRWDGLRSWLERSPPPYPLRVAVAGSAFAQHAVEAFAALGRGGPHAGGDRWPEYRRVLSALRDECRGRGVPLVAVLAPQRAELEPDEPQHGAAAASRSRFRATFADLGIPLLDAHEVFAPEVARGGTSPFFQSEAWSPRDMHLTARGHALLASWLVEALAPWTSDATPGASPAWGPP
jgi:hypothetical protein